MVGHDINYISIAGALHAAFAILAAIVARERTGRGQYVDIAMSDGVLYLLASAISGLIASGNVPERGATALNGALPHYNVYQCAAGGWISVGSLGPHFRANLCRALGREDLIPHQYSREKRDEVFDYFRATFRTKTRDEWFEALQQSGICAAPVYGRGGAPNDP